MSDQNSRLDSFQDNSFLSKLKNSWANFQKDAKEVRGENKDKYKRYTRRLWMLWLIGLLFVIIFFLGLSFSKDLPSTDQLQNPKNNLATEVLTANGNVLGRYYVENRVKVRYDELPESLTQALIATEDERFHDHAGIDMEALGRVVKGVAMGTTSKGGGSTITQQLAKMQYSDRRFKGNKIKVTTQLVLTKFKEWITAVQIEKRYTKDEIISMYLNEFDFLYGAVGIKSAAETYFGKSQDSLNIEESAMLVGMLKNPSLYNPKRDMTTAKKRREVVLSQMKKAGYISQVTYDSLRVLPISLAFSRKTHSEGIAPYFREELRSEVKKILERVSKEKNMEEAYNVHTDGLIIYTTIDENMQTHAENAVNKIMQKNQKKFFKEWKDKDPWTYRATDSEKEMRQNAFMKTLRNSDRYLAIRSQYLSEALEVINNSFKINLKDYDIERMISEEEDKGYLSRLKVQKLVSDSKVKIYRKILKDDAWPTLKNQYKELQKSAEKNFKEKTKMKIFTYENDAMEKDTVMSPWDSLRYIRMQLQTGVMAVDPHTGAIKAWVGGVNHKYFKFDHVNKSVERQVGSTFKPFIYATAIAQWGISPCYKVADIPYTIHKGEGCFDLLKDWTPKNFDEYTGEEFSLYEGLQKSKNTVSAYLMKKIGCHEPFRELAQNMGIDVDSTNVYGEERVPKQPSICLGATDLSVFEMTGAYATFANQGKYNEPYFIERIEDRNGVVIYDVNNDDNITKENAALNEDVNYVMIDMMKKVAKPIQWQLKSEVAGKTGTTNLHADAWFMGMSPNLVIGTWVGGDDRWIRFNSPHLGQGGVLARPIYVEMMKSIEKDSLIDYNENDLFKKPLGELSIRIDCSGIYGNPEEEGLSDDPTFDTDGGGAFGDEFDDDADLNFGPAPAPSAENEDEEEEEDPEGF